MYTIDIDTGSTFTDGFFTSGNLVERVKVETTPHDLTVCFMNCIEEGAKRFGLKGVAELLKQTGVVRFSSTVGTNALIQKTGPKVGLIVSKGNEQSLYRKDGQKSPVTGWVVEQDMIVGIDGELDSEGNEVTSLNEEEIKKVTRGLLSSGARVIVVSLSGSANNPEQERKVKQIIHQEYPTYYLGTVTVLLASELTSRPGEDLRTNAAVVNAYLHRDMLKYLYKADEDLRAAGYRQPLLVVHSRLGASRVARTTAINTCDAGPAASMVGSAYMSKLYGLKGSLAMEIGGTTCDLGLILDGQYAYNANPEVQGIPVNLPMVEVTSMGSAGGSIAKVDPVTKKLEVGPRSAGSRPGPACFDFGGSQATALDADVVLGYVNPDYFLGGKKKLNKQKAEKAIKDKVATPLGISVEEAALKVKEVFIAQVGEKINKLLDEKGISPTDLALFSYGGTGGLFSASIAAYAKIPKVYSFTYSSVFGAFGSSMMDISHDYEASPKLTLQQGSGAYLSDFGSFNQLVGEMQKSAYRDMKGEGFKPEDVVFELGLELKDEAGTCSCVIPYGRLSLESEADVKAICDTFRRECPKAKGSIKLGIVRLQASSSIPHCELVECKEVGKDPGKALKGMRPVYWTNGYVETPYYERKLLESGNVVVGPAIVEAEDTTFVVPAGRKYSVDKYLNGVIEEV